MGGKRRQMKGEAGTGIRFDRNNLDRSASPYLLQHAGNPVWWQEWNRGVLDHAVSQDKLLLVSSGYSTCHWCHVMAAGAFSDPETADFLNRNFVCIKIDREERPDIDQFLMHFCQEQNGTCGWPLNVFLTPGVRPFFALTYAPAHHEDGRMSFLDVAAQISGYYAKYGHTVQPFQIAETRPRETRETALISDLSDFYDDDFGGFGRGQKFPPHTTLLFLLYRLAGEEDPRIRVMCTETLDAMRMKGLHDHLQGGFFRYCTDRKWTIPHFEKMLYDQAMALWTYALAFKILEKEEYRTTALKTLACLEETFLHERFFVTAFNADTEHAEGATYLWSRQELAGTLTPEAFDTFTEAYDISEEGNFEGRNHLIRKSDAETEEIERKLLSLRNQRAQPSRDDKILSGGNALVAVALIQAGRLLDRPELEEKGSALTQRILDLFRHGTSLGHSLFNGHMNDHNFLTDIAALLLAVSLLAETNDRWFHIMEELTISLLTFRENGKWVESRAEDFMPVGASWFDHPTPSGVSLAEMVLTRAAILTGNDLPPMEYVRPWISDFYNINVMIRNGRFHVYTTSRPLPWSTIPAHSIQKRGTPETDCYRGSCQVMPILMPPLKSP